MAGDDDGMWESAGLLHEPLHLDNDPRDLAGRHQPSAVPGRHGEEELAAFDTVQVGFGDDVGADGARRDVFDLEPDTHR